ncbi:hypothetical protein ABTX85_08435 [Streptomyces sp. NPDC096097]|uniref:hypothetical protein n=1 Tax=Streptomyces sp. NPDC096097 TaxID=3155546 RepID=UPI0033181936
MGWTIGWIFLVFSLSTTLSVILSIRGVTLLGPASFAAAGSGVLVSGMERGETTFTLIGVVLIAAGLSSVFLMARFARLPLHGLLGARLFTRREPRERRTRLCRFTDLDQRFLPLLEETVHKYSLGELRSATRLCCETRYADNGGLPRGTYAGPVPVIEACVLTEKLVIIAIVYTEGAGVALVGRLQQTMLSEVSHSEGEHEAYVRSAWLDSTEASSYPFPLDDGPAGEEFVAEFRAMLSAARHT